MHAGEHRYIQLTWYQASKLLLKAGSGRLLPVFMRKKATLGSRLMCVKNALTRNYLVISDVAGGGAALFQVLLVVLLGAPKGACGDDLGCNWCAKTLLGGEPGDGLAGGRFLF